MNTWLKQLLIVALVLFGTASCAWAAQRDAGSKIRGDAFQISPSVSVGPVYRAPAPAIVRTQPAPVNGLAQGRVAGPANRVFSYQPAPQAGAKVGPSVPGGANAARTAPQATRRFSYEPGTAAGRGYSAPATGESRGWGAATHSADAKALGKF